MTDEELKELELAIGNVAADRNRGAEFRAFAGTHGRALIMEVKRLRRRCKFLEDVIVCYRIGKDPSELFLRDLDETKEVVK